jgi:acetyl-CoA C-acetyltransferase
LDAIFQLGVLNDLPSEVKEKMVVDQVILGNVLSSGLGQCPATQATLKAGLPSSTISYSVNKVCASGMKGKEKLVTDLFEACFDIYWRLAIMIAAETIQLGRADVIIAGGMESMSNVPHYLIPPTKVSRRGYGNMELIDGLMLDGLTDSASGNTKDVMGHIAEKTANKYGISRSAQVKAIIYKVYYYKLTTINFI